MLLCDFWLPGVEVERVPFLGTSISLLPHACMPCSSVIGYDVPGHAMQCRAVGMPPRARQRTQYAAAAHNASPVGKIAWDIGT